MKSTACSTSAILKAYEDQRGTRSSFDESGGQDELGESMCSQNDTTEKISGVMLGVKEKWLRGLLAFEKAKSQHLQEKLENLQQHSLETIRAKDQTIEDLKEKAQSLVTEYEQALEALRRAKIEGTDQPTSKVVVKEKEKTKRDKLSNVVKDQISRNRVATLEKLVEEKSRVAMEAQALAMEFKTRIEELENKVNKANNANDVMETRYFTLQREFDEYKAHHETMQGEGSEKDAAVRKRIASLENVLNELRSENQQLKQNLEQTSILLQAACEKSSVPLPLPLPPPSPPPERVYPPLKELLGTPVIAHFDPPPLPPAVASVSVMCTILTDPKPDPEPEPPRVVEIVQRVETEKADVIKTIKKQEPVLAPVQKEEIVKTMDTEESLVEEEEAIKKVLKLVKRVKEESRKLKLPSGNVIMRMERMVAEMQQKWELRRLDILNERKGGMTKVLTVMGLASENNDITPLEMYGYEAQDKCVCVCNCRRCRAPLFPVEQQHPSPQSSPLEMVMKQASKPIPFNLRETLKPPRESAVPSRTLALFSSDSSYIKTSTFSLVEPRVTTLARGNSKRTPTIKPKTASTVQPAQPSSPSMAPMSLPSLTPHIGNPYKKNAKE